MIFSKELFRSNQKKVKKLFVIGNGCMLKGTHPLQLLLSQLKNMSPSPLFPIFEKNDPMHSLSCLAAQERDYLSMLFHSYIKTPTGDAAFNPPEVDGKPGVLRVVQTLAHAASFRKAMGDYYVESSHINWNPKIKQILENLGINNKDSALITPNWDNTLWLDQNLENLLHLHGKCTDPMTMIFPTETIREYALHVTLLNSISSDLHSDFRRHTKKEYEYLKLVYERFLVENNEYEKMFACENKLIAWLSEVEEIYFCGLAFNSYDHELTNTFHQGIFNFPKKQWNRVVIVNRINKKIDEEERKKKTDEKIEMIATLLGIQSNTIEFIDTEAR